jgi:phospholipase/lecithinase/hemolysin
MPAIIKRLSDGAPAGATRTAAKNAITAAVVGASGGNLSQRIGAALMAALTDAGNNLYTNEIANAAFVNAEALVGLATADATAAGAAAGAEAGAAYAAGAGAANAVNNMSTAGKDLADAVKSMLASGAKKVVVMNIPDASQTPYGVGAGPQKQPLILEMVKAFNNRLKAELAGQQGVLLLDVFAENQEQFRNPTLFGLTNVTTAACTTSASTCNPTNVIAGNISHYLFADDVHPTAYGHKLLAQFVMKELVLAGWL